LRLFGDGRVAGDFLEAGSRFFCQCAFWLDDSRWLNGYLGSGLDAWLFRDLEDRGVRLADDGWSHGLDEARPQDRHSRRGFLRGLTSLPRDWCVGK
jgi:hypothetical protein